MTAAGSQPFSEQLVCFLPHHHCLIIFAKPAKLQAKNNPDYNMTVMGTALLSWNRLQHACPMVFFNYLSSVS